MRITRLRLRDLKVHRDLDLELAPGLTVVRGPNEAGKTTLQRALELALFRKVTAGGAEIDALRSWGSPDDGRPWVALEFVQEDPEGTRVGTLEKDFRGAKGTARLVLDGETVTDPARVDEILADLTGIPGEKFFRSTASVRHHEVFDLARDEGALRDRLQASISGADRGTSVAKRRLDRALRELQARGERNPGRLRVAEEAVARSEAILAQGEAQLAQLERDRDALAAARERRAAAEHVLAERRSLLEKARQAERLVAERDVAQERFERYRQAVAVADQIAELEGSHPSPNPLPVLRQLVERTRVLDRQIGELRAQLGEEPSSVDYQVAIPEPRYRPFAWLAVLLAVGGVIAVAVGVFAGVAAAVVGGVVGRGRRAPPGRLRPRSPAGRLRLPAPEAAPRRRDRPAPPGTEPAGGRPAPRRGGPHGPAGHDRGRRSGGGGGPPRPRGRPRPGDRPGAGAARRPRRQGAGRDAAHPARRGRPRRSSRRPGPSRRSGRSPRSRAPASGSRSRSATRRAPWSGPATTRPPPGPASSRTPWTPSRSPARPSAWRRGARSWPPSSAASGSTRRASTRSAGRRRRRCAPRRATSRSGCAATSPA